MIRFSIGTAVAQSDCLIVALCEGNDVKKQIQQLDSHVQGLVLRVIQSKDFEGKKGQLSMLYPENALYSRLFLVGLGKEADITMRGWKHTLGAAVKQAQGKKCTTMQLVLSLKALKKLGAISATTALVVAAENAAYSFDEHKESDARVTLIKKIELIIFDKKQEQKVQTGIDEGSVIAKAVQMARHLGNITPSIMTPTYLAKQAKELSNKKNNLNVSVLSRPEIKKLGMGCLLGVSSGSLEEPKFIIVEYNGSTKKTDKPTILVGKGITFDSGGLSLKPGNYMTDMKFDMLGAATVLGAIKAAAGLKLKKNIIGLIPSCENMPSGSSYRPDDILIAMNGKSILIENTDAEGRLILADALSYATMKYTPEEVIDLATLTGACLVALGNERSGLFGTSDVLIKKLLHSSEAVGEHLWHLPMGEEYSEAVKSEIADIKNLGGVGSPRYAGASTAAAFLQLFTQNKKGETPYKWAHIDLSCSYYGGKGKSYIRSGANGFGVETLVDYLRS
jgi:leucyl aminopeptidase